MIIRNFCSTQIDKIKYERTESTLYFCGNVLIVLSYGKINGWNVCIISTLWHTSSLSIYKITQ